MPHAELRYSDDLKIDAPAILAAIEATIHRHDAGSGACKGRAYPAPLSHHSHMAVSVSMLSKPHRDAAFTKALMAEIEALVKGRIAQPCHFSLALEYSSGAYVTNLHEGAQ